MELPDRFFVHPDAFPSLKDYHLQGYVDGLALNYSELPKAIEVRVNFCKAKHLTFNSSSSSADAKKTYNDACFADTFFSDTFPDTELRKLVHEVQLPNNDKRTFRFLLLDPLCELARLRAGTLEGPHPSSTDLKWCLGRLNKGLFRIKCALSGENFDDEEGKKKYLDKWPSPRWTQELLELIKQAASSRKDLTLEIKFTSEWLEMPLYIFGCYAFHGMISPTASALKNPWIVYRDYSDEPTDLFSTLQADFDSAWDKPQNLSSEAMHKKLTSARDRARSVFVAHGGESVSLKEIAELIESHRWVDDDHFKKVLFSDKKAAGRTDGEVWRDCFEASAAAIVLVTKDDLTIERHRGRAVPPPVDEKPDYIWNPRQNVMVELGYALARFGSKRVLILEENGVAVPSNNPGEAASKFAINGGKVDSHSLRERVKRFLDYIAGRNHD